MSCIYCDIAQGKEKVEKVYEDKDNIAFLSQQPSAIGHIILIPKKHYTILEQVPNNHLAEMINIANKLSSAVFESIGAGGTNIFVQNGTDAGQVVPHFAVHIIPRREGDNINLQWLPKQVSEEEMSRVELVLKEACKNIYATTEAQPEPIVHKEEKKEVTGEDNYLIKHLDRIP